MKIMVSLVRGTIGQNFPVRRVQALVPCNSSPLTLALDSFSLFTCIKIQITQTIATNLQEQFLPLPTVGQGAILDQLFLELAEFWLLWLSPKKHLAPSQMLLGAFLCPARSNKGLY